MKIQKFCTGAIASIALLLHHSLAAAETNATTLPVRTATEATNSAPAQSAMADLNDLITRVNQKLQQGLNHETNLTDNIKEFDTLLAKYKDAKPSERAQILLMKAKLFAEVLDEPEKALDAYQQIKRDCPGVEITGLDDVIQGLDKQIALQKVQRTLVPGVAVPPINEIDITGKPLQLSSYKGKVVLIDFWATWCAPCMGEFPQVQKTYEKYHAKGFDIIGVSLDMDRTKLENFIKEKKVPWQQFNDGKFWDTKLVPLYGVSALPATFLLGRDGKIVKTNLRGDELQEAVAFEVLPWYRKRLIITGRTVDGWIRGYPYASLGVIFAAGLLLGFSARRKNAVQATKQG